MFGVNVNVRSGAFFMCSEAGQKYNIRYFVLINIVQYTHLKQL